ncbi:serine/threonine-protein kinase 19 isoform X1 [Carya illinoinensis]|uniref:serine/threonine-protein kinase 19 isoform X1 n=1 Tax=Carya illinoinensis TaxID=32201 RepID=UPI001C719EF5|nr:serine/threonine-protein kinase 19 isoform X1 [Carya illinoinensis]
MDEIPEPSSRGRKRLRDQEDTELQCSDLDQTLSLEENLPFSDTLVALRMMRGQFPHIEKVAIQPFVLRSQLYSSVKDRTQVDRELEVWFLALILKNFVESRMGYQYLAIISVIYYHFPFYRWCLRREKVVRIFKLNTGQDDHAVMFLDDYLNQIECVVKRLGEKKQGDLEVFKWFRTHVVDAKLESSIEHQELHTLLSLGGKVKDGHISLLINAGLFTRQLIDPNMYWFAIPNIGSVLKGLSQGRKEVLSFLNRRRYKEMMLTSMEKKRLRLSPLDMRFHLRDLIGSGHLKTNQTSTGLVVQVSKD